ncbi:MAG: hypothetical protein ACYTFT_10980 [Planctomycetota bacterium]
MRPPICELCDDRFGEGEGGLVGFARRPSDRAWHERADAEPGFVGHPPEVAWFCGKHYETAKALADLPIDQAMSRLRADLG